MPGSQPGGGVYGRSSRKGAGTYPVPASVFPCTQPSLNACGTAKRVPLANERTLGVALPSKSASATACGQNAASSSAGAGSASAGSSAARVHGASSASAM